MTKKKANLDPKAIARYVARIRKDNEALSRMKPSQARIVVAKERAKR